MLPEGIAFTCHVSGSCRGLVEDGEWHYVITDESREDYALGVEKAIAKRKADGGG